MTLSALSILSSCQQPQSQQQNQSSKGDYHLVVGTYTKPGQSEGIYLYDYQSQNADTHLESITKDVINPSFLAIPETQDFIYAVNEAGDESTISAFSYDQPAGKLKFLNKQDAKGADPCYLIADDKYVISANYSGGTISVFGRLANGQLSPAQQVIQHKGSGPDTSRQQSAHVHMVQFSPDHQYVLATDLGSDQIFTYKYTPTSSKEILQIQDSIAVSPGSGPRHLTFSPNGKYVYLIQEMTASITAYHYAAGKLHKIQEISMLEPGFKGENGAAAIQVSSDGKFLYASNRGTANSITTFAIADDGKLTTLAHTPTLGNGPRAFSIDPSGKWLLVGHQYTNQIVIFSRNPKDGSLKDSGKRIEVGAPVSLNFLPKK